MKELSIAVLALVACVTPAFTQSLADGAAANQRGDYQAALKIFTALADQGDAVAQTLVGNLYANGPGVLADSATALKWYLLAAQNETAPTQFAEVGIEFGQLQEQIAIMYGTGTGTPQNYEESIKWDRLAAKNGNLQGQFNLGVKYYNGDGVKRDFELAYMWFEISEINGPGSGIKMRDTAAQQLTKADALLAQAAASKCVKSNYDGCQ